VPVLQIHGHDLLETMSLNKLPHLLQDAHAIVCRKAQDELVCRVIVLRKPCVHRVIWLDLKREKLLSMRIAMIAAMSAMRTIVDAPVRTLVTDRHPLPAPTPHHLVHRVAIL